MKDKITTESRALLKESFDYPIFMYQADFVGITATGEADKNELVNNENMPPDVIKSCLELYQEFKQNPSKFFTN
jgi:type I restriction enzyme M protein